MVSIESCLPTMLVSALMSSSMPFSLPLPSRLPHSATPAISPSMSVRMAFSSYRSFPPYFFIVLIFLQVHPHLTLRSRTHAKPQSDSDPLLHRHTSLTCLICRLSVYRVLQLIPPDMDATEGPVLPTEEWVEHQVLQSGSGWIELAKQCLVSPFRRKSVFLAFSSALFCSPFGLFKDR